MTEKKQTRLLRQADASYYKGEALFRHSKTYKAAEKLAQAVSLYEQIFYTDKMLGCTNFAQALVSYGSAVQVLGQFAEAREAFTRAIQIYAGLKNKRGVAMVSVLLARIETDSWRRRIHYQRAINIYQISDSLNQMEIAFLSEAKGAAA